MAHREGIREFLKHVDLKGKKVIDWGCGTKPIKNYLKGGAEYFGIDKLDHVGADLVADIDSETLFIGTLDARYIQAYDVAFCLEVLEHVDYPEVTLRNIHHSLKENGTLYLSVPFLYDVHSDHDLWRFTDQGLRFLLEKSGFELLKITSTTNKHEGWVLEARKV